MHFTPLLAAIRYVQPQTVQLLLKNGANVLAKDRLRHYNAVLWAVEIQNPDILKVSQLTFAVFSYNACNTSLTVCCAVHIPT